MKRIVKIICLLSLLIIIGFGLISFVLAGSLDKASATTENLSSYVGVFIKIADNVYQYMYVDKETRIIYQVSNSQDNKKALKAVLNTDDTPLIFNGEIK